MERKVRARFGWWKISPGSGTRPFGQEGFLGIRPQIEEAARTCDGAGALLVDGHAVGQFDGGFNLFGERFGSEIAQRHQPGVHHAGHQSRQNAGHRNDAFQSARIQRQDFARPGLVLHEELGGGELGHGADARDGVDLAGLGANQDGRFAAHAEMRELSHRGGEHGRHARIHCVSAMEEDVHAGLFGVFAAGGESAVGAASGVHGGDFKILALRGSRTGANQEEKQGGQLVLHMASLIIAVGLGIWDWGWGGRVKLKVTIVTVLGE